MAMKGDRVVVRHQGGITEYATFIALDADNRALCWVRMERDNALECVFSDTVRIVHDWGETLCPSCCWRTADDHDRNNTWPKEAA